MAWITICITTGKRGDAHFPGGDEGAPITDSVSGRHLTNERDARFPGHRRTYEALKFRQRRNAVDQHPGTHDLERLLRESEHAGCLQCMRFVIARHLDAQLLD